MKYSLKQLTSKAFLVYALANLFAYTIFHTAYLNANDAAGVVIEYISFYVSRSLEFVASPLIAVLALMVYLSYDKKKALLFTLAIASARVFYLIPYNYIIAIYNYGYDSLESLLLSLVETVLAILITVLGALVSIAVAHIIFKSSAKHPKKNGSASPLLLSSYSATRASFDFLKTHNRPILIFVLLRFGVSLISEIIDTVLYLIDYASDYTAAEIIFLLVNYVHILVLLVVAYLLCMLVKNAVMKKGEADIEGASCEDDTVIENEEN